MLITSLFAQPAVEAAVIAMLSAVLVSIINYLLQRRLFEKQQRLLANLNTGKRIKDERLEAVKQVLDSVTHADRAVTGLRDLRNGTDLIDQVAESFQSAGRFYQHLRQFERDLVTPEDIKQKSRRVERALTDFFLALDFDGNPEDSKYTKKLQNKADEFSKEKNELVNILKRHYQGDE